MRKLRDFKCKDCLSVTEKLVNDDVEVVMCSGCCGNAEKQLSAPAGSGNAAHGFMAKAKTNTALRDFIKSSSEQFAGLSHTGPIIGKSEG